MKALHALGIAIEEGSGVSPRPGMSIVVIKYMLWARFSSEYIDVRQGLHVKGPVAGDVVLVTDEPVVLAIQKGSMSVARAFELGVLRAYATDQQSEEVSTLFGSIGETPLPRPGLPTPGDIGLFNSSPAQGLQ